MGKTMLVENVRQLDAVIRGNASRMVMAPNSRFNQMLLAKDNMGEFKDIPKELRNTHSWFTGTGFAIEAKDKAFKDKIENQFYNKEAGKQQTLVYYVRKEDIGSINIMNLFEHGFREDGENLVQLFDAKHYVHGANNKQILTVEELHQSDEIIMKVVGEIRNHDITHRYSFYFEEFHQAPYLHNKTELSASDYAALGFLVRNIKSYYDIVAKHKSEHLFGDYVKYNGREDIYAGYGDFDKCHAVLFQEVGLNEKDKPVKTF